MSNPKSHARTHGLSIYQLWLKQNDKYTLVKFAKSEAELTSYARTNKVKGGSYHMTMRVQMGA